MHIPASPSLQSLWELYAGSGFSKYFPRRVSCTWEPFTWPKVKLIYFIDLKCLLTFSWRWHWKVKKEAPAPPKAKAKAKAKVKALKAKKAVLKGIHSHTHRHAEDPCATLLARLKTLWLWRQPIYPQEEDPQEKPAWLPCHHWAPPDYQDSQDNRRHHYMCVHCGGQGQPAPGQTVCEEARDTDVAKVNTWSGLMERRKHMFHWLQTMMLWMLPTKLGSSKLSPAG